MARTVIPSEEVDLNQDIVTLLPPQEFSELAHSTEGEEEDEETEEHEGADEPTLDELRKEAEDFKLKWESERNFMIHTARTEAENIVKQAETTAFQEVKRKTDEAQIIRQKATEEADRIIAEAKQKAQELETSAQGTLEQERKEVYAQATLVGREAGYTEGKAEVTRLIERVRTVLERAQEERAEILSETEGQIVDLVLLIARKIIKIISESQRDIIISNVIEALRKVKSRSTVNIRVNIADLKLTTDHTREFIALMEGVKDIHILEDSSVDPGGCIIETDLGEVDARISSQLSELESKILEISPIVTKAKTEKV
ncbi:MAG: flagellar assembly protein FliH [Treponema sp.]|jgi:flagellar assembly protein FliH|nr:flagellar assembly protein FliH [Treponema sp.]